MCQLEPVHRDAVLPTGPGPLVARDLRRAGQRGRQVAASGVEGRAEAIDAGLRQSTSTVATLSDRVRAVAGDMPGRGGPAGRQAVSVQEQTDEPRRQRHRPVVVAVRLGAVSADQGGDHATPPAGSRRVPTLVCGDHRGQDQRPHGGAADALRAGNGLGDRPRLYRRRLVRRRDAPGRVLRDPAETPRRSSTSSRTGRCRPTGRS